MDKGLVRIHADRLERAAWTLVFLSIFSLSLNPYDTAIGFWGVFCAYSKHGRATFGCINCVIFSLIFDIVTYYSYTHSWHFTSYYPVTLAYSVITLSKIFVVYSASHMFAALGGTSSMDMEGSRILNESAYDTLVGSMNSVNASGIRGGSGGYYPPDDLSHSEILDEGGRDKV